MLDRHAGHPDHRHRVRDAVPSAGIHQLRSPMLTQLEHLPAPQRNALFTAFGLREGAGARPMRRWRGHSTSEPIPTSGHGTGRPRPPAPTRRSPPTASAGPTAPGRAAAWRPPARCWSAPASSARATAQRPDHPPARELSAATRRPRAAWWIHAAELLLAACRGREAETRRLAGRCLRQAFARWPARRSRRWSRRLCAAASGSWPWRPRRAWRSGPRRAAPTGHWASRRAAAPCSRTALQTVEFPDAKTARWHIEFEIDRAPNRWPDRRDSATGDRCCAATRPCARGLLDPCELGGCHRVRLVPR
jgi:hypothetical protein